MKNNNTKTYHYEITPMQWRPQTRQPHHPRACRTLSVGCDKQKSAVNENKEATKEAIDIRKDEVNVAAKKATAQTDANAAIDKAQIEANKKSLQAQLDADKKGRRRGGSRQGKDRCRKQVMVPLRVTGNINSSMFRSVGL